MWNRFSLSGDPLVCAPLNPIFEPAFTCAIAVTTVAADWPGTPDTVVVAPAKHPATLDAPFGSHRRRRRAMRSAR